MERGKEKVVFLSFCSKRKEEYKGEKIYKYRFGKGGKNK